MFNDPLPATALPTITKILIGVLGLYAGGNIVYGGNDILVLVHNIYVHAETESRPHTLILLSQYYHMLRYVYTCTCI
jgi:hypothetical protein